MERSSLGYGTRSSYVLKHGPRSEIASIEGAGRGSGGFWCGTGPRVGTPRTPGPLPALPRRTMGELPPAGSGDGLDRGRRATGDLLSVPYAAVRLKPRRLPLRDAGLGSGRPTRRGTVPDRRHVR